MYKYSTEISIDSLDEIYDFRGKIYEVVESLASEPTLPSRISSGLSSCLRDIISKQQSCLVAINLEMSERSSLLNFSLNGTGDYQILQPFFDNRSANGGTVLQKFFPATSNQEKNFDFISKLLGEKSKEKLESEIRAKQQELHQTNLEKHRMENELNVAKDIQLSMLPLVFPAFPHRQDIDVYAHLIPAREVGGDFYDFHFIDENHLCIAVGDVSGKGVPAALMMAVCKTLLKSRAGTDKSTASIITHVNNEMAKDNKNFMFVTVFLAILHTGTGELRYTNAGHNPTYIRRQNGEVVKLTELHGPVVAAMEDMAYKESVLRLEKGDKVFAYTDGVTEAHNLQNEQFSDARLRQWLQHSMPETPELVVKGIVQEIHTFESGREQFDDITALCLHYKGTNNEESIYMKKLAIRNEMEEVQTAIAALEAFGEEHEISMATVMKVSVVVDELLSNIVKYGFADGVEHLIDVSMELQGRKLLLTFSDDGIPFNPFQRTPPDLTKSIEERELGGLGVHLVRELMDDFDYRREINRNVVSVVKNNV